MGKRVCNVSKRKAMIVQQIMVPLSLNRLTTSLRAFTYKDGSRFYWLIYDSTRKRKVKTKEIVVFVYMLSFKSSTFGNGLWFGCRLFFECIE